MTKYRVLSIWLVALLIGISYFLYASESGKMFANFPFRYGLDISGGTELVYRADISKLPSEEIDSSMATLRDVVERRVNAFGVSEAIVQVEKSGVITGSREERLVVELPGVTDTEKAIDIIGATPTLEFKLAPTDSNASTTEKDLIDTGLTGRLLERAQLEFQGLATGGTVPNQPYIVLHFNEEGRELVAKITKENIGRVMAIVLDGTVISAPVIEGEIPDGNAIINGQFTPEDARTLVRNLNYGALPVPIELVGTQVVGASLGAEAKDLGVRAGMWGFILVFIFLIAWYRLPGLLAAVALLLYIAISLAIFKLIPVTLTAAGIAGFIISMGMAIDANVLIFERIKDELRNGKKISEAVREGFSRAWLPVRDANLSGIITAIILFWLGNAAVKGFALTLGIGNIVSMFTAVTVVRTFLFAVSQSEKKADSPIRTFLFGGKQASRT